MKNLTVFERTFLSLVLGCFSVLLTAQEIHTKREIRWESGLIILEANIDLSGGLSPLPLTRYEAEQYIRQNLLELSVNGLADIPVESDKTIKDTILSNPEVLDSLETLTSSYTPLSSYFSKNLKKFNLSYNFPFYPDLFSIFVRHHSPLRIPVRLVYVPTTDFSGIIIYAKGEYPLHGESKEVSLSPGFFPKFYDEEMNLFFSKDMLPGEVLLKWGAVQYSSNNSISAHSRRIGKKPFTTIIKAIFGIHHTDLILSNEDVQKILYNANNRKLLKEGRVVIICDF